MRLLDRVFAERRKSGGTDLEAVEMAMRSALHCAGAAALGQLLHYGPPAADQRWLPCVCGQQAQYVELRTKQVLTVLGPTPIERPYYLCRSCHRGQFPADRELDIQGTEFSPGVRRMMGLLGHEVAFNSWARTTETARRPYGNDQSRRTHGGSHWPGYPGATAAGDPPCQAIGITRRGRTSHSDSVHPDRRHRRTGDPCRDARPAGKQPGQPAHTREAKRCKRDGERACIGGQPAHTREAKLGCLFTQTATDAEGRPVRDADSTSYVGAMETAEEFGLRLYAEAWRRGWDRAALKVFMGDGAVRIWNIGDRHFPGAVQIVDLYHAREHLWNLAPKLYPNDAARQRRWIMSAQDKLDNGRIESLLTSLRALRPVATEVIDMVRTEAGYFEANAERMRYPEFRRQGLFVGTGVMEAGCKTVIGSRLKQSGMFWTVRGANAIIALRCCELSGNFEDYWEARRA
jgi:hypothetical protein